VPKHFSYDPQSHRGDPTGGSYTRFEPRHLDDPRFPHRGSHPTGSNGEL
jgi:hypothetical protein